MQIRTPAVAGMFYPSDSNELKKSIHDCYLHPFGPGKLPLDPSSSSISSSPSGTSEKIFGVICPHAGYMYSGPIASHSYYSISSKSYDLVIIIGPNHWGIGCSVAAMREGRWQTPLGFVEVDSKAAKQLENISKIVELDYFSHIKDHCLEVQIPMLQQLYSNKFKILPIILINQDYDAANEIGNAIAKIAQKENTMIVGSSDFTHYEENEFAHKQDKVLIEQILSLDLEQFYSVLQERRISACGYGAIASTMAACKKMGATKGKLLKYATSGDVTGDKSSVVGYASIVFT